MNLLATNKQFKNGLLTGMILAKKIHQDKKNARMGGKNLKGGFDFKKVLAVAAGPLGWVWLAKHSKDAEIAKLQKEVEKYNLPPSTKDKKKTKEKIDISDFPEEDINIDDDEDLPMDDFDDFDPDDFE